MAQTIPVVITDNSGGVSIEVVGMTYETFLNSLGTNVFRVLELYMSASSLSQFFEQIKYSISDATGLKFEQVLNYAVDPYQKIPAYTIDLRDEMIVLNGQSNIEFNLLAGETLMLQLLCDQRAPGDALDIINPNVPNNLDKDDDVVVMVTNPANPNTPPVNYTVTDTEKILTRPQDVKKPELKLNPFIKKKISTSILKKQTKTL